MTQQDPSPQSSLRSDLGWAFTSVLSIIFQVFAIFLGLIMMGLGAMTTDSCSGSNSCNESALHSAAALGSFGPAIILIASGSFAAVKAHQNKQDSKEDAHTPAVILLAGAGIDLVLLLGEYSSFSHVDSMRYLYAIRPLIHY